MGYDFEAEEDGELTVEIYNHHDGTEREKHKFTVRKGQKYSMDEYGVKVRWR